MPTAELRFSVAALEVLLRSPQPDGLDHLSGFYRHYPSSGAPPALEVEFEKVPGFARGRRRGPGYPGFERTWVAPDTVALSRFDAEGELVLPQRQGAPIRARFRGGDSANTLEAAVRIGASVAMPRRGGLVMHASAVSARGKAWLFAGVSGAGKSTIATLLAGSSPARARVSDELLIVAPQPDGGFAAHVTPFLGSEGLPHRTSLPVAAIHFLQQAPYHRRTPLAPGRALRELLRHVLAYVAEPMTASHVLDAASRLVGEIPCYWLEFARDAGVAEVLGMP